MRFKVDVLTPGLLKTKARSSQHIVANTCSCSYVIELSPDRAIVIPLISTLLRSNYVLSFVAMQFGITSFSFNGEILFLNDGCTHHVL
jgi:hypothetical protein